jgi:hypothetical protein
MTIVLITRCNEKEIVMDPNGDIYNDEPSIEAPQKKRIYKSMDFRDEDGKWIHNLYHSFFIKKKDEQKIVIATKIQQGYYILPSVYEWFEDNSINILSRDFQDKFQYFTLATEDVRIHKDSLDMPEIDTNIDTENSEDTVNDNTLDDDSVDNNSKKIIENFYLDKKHTKIKPNKYCSSKNSFSSNTRKQKTNNSKNSMRFKKL